MSDASGKPKRLKKVGISLGAFVVLVLCVLWFMGVFGGNVRVVDQGRYYRSAQLSGVTLENVIHKYGIKSVINLRGPQGDEEAYQSELAICRDNGVSHEDVSLSASHLPPPKELNKAIADLDKLPKPVLVHCKGGSDRTGLVSTLYVNLYDGVPLDQAENRELTWRYGHLAFTNTRAMNQFFDMYRQDGRGEDLRTWIAKTYPSLYAARQASGGKDIGRASKNE